MNRKTTNKVVMVTNYFLCIMYLPYIYTLFSIKGVEQELLELRVQSSLENLL